MFTTFWTTIESDGTTRDHFALHDTEAQAMECYRTALSEYDNLHSAGVSKVTHATEPHWMEATA